MTQLEFDYQVWQRFGSLGVALGLGYFTKSGRAFVCTSGSGVGCTPDFEQPSGDETSLSLLPLSLLAVYRFDLLALQTRIPLVPYVKFGLTYTLWWINKGNDKVSDATIDGSVEHGRNWQFGLTAVGGVAIMLDAIDAGAGRELDGALGINHTYVFWEWAWSGAEGLGASHPLRIGDSSWLAGLAFEF